MINVDDSSDTDTDDDLVFTDDVTDISVPNAKVGDVSDEVVSVRDSPPISENTCDMPSSKDSLILIKDDFGEVIDFITRFPSPGSMHDTDYSFESLSENLIYFGDNTDSFWFPTKDEEK